MILRAAFAAVLLAGCTASSNDLATTTSGSIEGAPSTVSSTTTTVATTTAPAPTTTTLPPTTTTTEPPGWEPVVVEGSGDDVVAFSVPGNDPSVLELTHSGTSNFVATSYTADNERIDLLVNVIGSYSGRVPINFLVGEDIAFIEISADGGWTLTATALAEEPLTTQPANGEGDDVLIMSISSPIMDVSHDGDSNFILVSWTTTDRDLLVNEIGLYDGTVRVATGTVIFVVSSEGSWTLSEG